MHNCYRGGAPARERKSRRVGIFHLTDRFYVYNENMAENMIMQNTKRGRGWKGENFTMQNTIFYFRNDSQLLQATIFVLLSTKFFLLVFQEIVCYMH